MKNDNPKSQYIENLTTQPYTIHWRTLINSEMKSLYCKYRKEQNMRIFGNNYLLKGTLKMLDIDKYSDAKSI